MHLRLKSTQILPVPALAVVLGSLALVGPEYTGAQEPPGAYIEEIVVTSQKREENLQEVPISITALSETMIEDRGIKNVTDMFSSAPGVVGYEAVSSRGNIGVSLRGIGSGNASNLSIDPANAMYIDGVYLGKATGLGVDTFDLERIEVLRGPQGTLYGRNSTGGAINFITRKPGDEFGLRASASAGDYGLQEYKLRVDVPFSETFMTSISGMSRERDDLYDNTNPNSPGFENIDRLGWRFAARWQPSDTFTVDYAYDHSEIDENTQAVDLVGFNPQGAGVLTAPGFPTNVTIRSSNRRDNVAALQGGLQGALDFGFIPPLPQVTQLNQWMIDYIEFADEVLASGSSRKGHRGSAESPHQSSNENDGHSLTLTWNVDDMGAFGDVEFKSITGWREMSNVNYADLDGSDNTVDTGIMDGNVLLTIGSAFFGLLGPFPAQQQFGWGLSMMDQINARGRAEGFNTYQTNDYEQFSEELQMVGSTDTVDYAVGFFYFDDEGKRRSNTLASYPLAATFTNSYDNDSTAWSVYSQVTWLPSVDSRFSLTGGLRYTEEEKNVTLLHRSNAIPFGFIGALLGGIPFDNLYATPETAGSMPEVPGVFGRSFSKDFDNLSGKITLAYNFTDTVNGYVTYSTGYRSGGFNGEAFDAVRDSVVDFNEETIENMEVGIKTDLWDRRMRLNATYFAYTYDDLQISTLAEEQGVVTSRVSNSGKAERNGLEVELTLLPIEDLLIALNYTYIDGDFDEFPPLIASAAAGGASLQQADLAQRTLLPDNQLSFNVDWTIAEVGTGLLQLNVNGAWQEEAPPIGINGFVYNAIPDAASTPDTPVVMEQLLNDERTLINARLALNEMQVGEGSLSIGVWGRNLTDDDHRVFSFNFGPGLGYNLAYYGEPKTYGLDLIYRY